MSEGRGSRVERALCWGLIGLVALVGVVALRDSWLRVGRVAPGFALMENGQAGAGGAPRGGLAPLDVITAVNGRPVSGAAEILAEVARHPSGTALTYSAPARQPAPGCLAAHPHDHARGLRRAR